MKGTFIHSLQYSRGYPSYRSSARSFSSEMQYTPAGTEQPSSGSMVRYVRRKASRYPSMTARPTASAPGQRPAICSRLRLDPYAR